MKQMTFTDADADADAEYAARKVSLGQYQVGKRTSRHERSYACPYH